MRRTPSNEDEQSEQPQADYPMQRRRSIPPRTGRIPRLSEASPRYRTDEQPQVPKVRRASLYNDESQVVTESPAPKVRRPAPTSSRTMRPVGTTKERRARTPSTAKVPAIQPEEGVQHGRGYQDTEPTHYEELYDERRTGKITVARQRRRNVYEPPPVAHLRPRGKHQPRTLLSILQDISHNQTLLLIGAIVLVALIVLPIVVNASLSALRSHDNGTIVTGTTSNPANGQPGVSAPAADPRELVIVPPNGDRPAPPVYATSAYLIDADTGVTLYAHNPFLHLPMMSTTKLMTATLAVEQGNLDRKVTINATIANDLKTLSTDSSVMGIKPGEIYTLRELLYGLILVSGNDAAIAIADTVDGNLRTFVAHMNQKAAQLGLHDTHYMNPHGLLATGHYSSAHDLAILARYAFNIPDLHKISGTKSYNIPKTNAHPTHFLINGDQFLWWYPGVDAGKPGWDGGSNFVQVVSVTRNKHHLIGVIMHTLDWWTDMRNLINYGLNDFTWVSPYDVDIAHPPIPFDYDWNYFVKDKKTNTIPTVDQGRYYIYTGYSINGPIMKYFDSNGGLNKFGYPTGNITATNGTVISQSFEHKVIQCDTAKNSCKTI